MYCPRPGKLRRVPQGVRRFLGHFSGKRQQTAQSFHAYKAPNALQGIGQDLRGDGVAALPHLGPEDLQVFPLRIRVLPSVEGSLLPVDISVERVSLRIPVVGVLAAGLVDEGVDLRHGPAVCDGVQLFTGGVQNLVVVVLHCLFSGVGRSLFPAAGGQQQSQGKDTGDYMSFHGCLLCFSVGGVR